MSGQGDSHQSSSAKVSFSQVSPFLKDTIFANYSLREIDEALLFNLIKKNQTFMSKTRLLEEKKQKFYEQYSVPRMLTPIVHTGHGLVFSGASMLFLLFKNLVYRSKRSKTSTFVALLFFGGFIEQLAKIQTLKDIGSPELNNDYLKAEINCEKLIKYKISKINGLAELQNALQITNASVSAMIRYNYLY